MVLALAGDSTTTSDFPLGLSAAGSGSAFPGLPAGGPLLALAPNARFAGLAETGFRRPDAAFRPAAVAVPAPVGLPDRCVSAPPMPTASDFGALAIPTKLT